MCAHCQYTHKNWHDATHSKNTWWGSITCPPPTPPLNSCVALHVTLALSDPQFPDLLSPSFSNHCLSLTKTSSSSEWWVNSWRKWHWTCIKPSYFDSASQNSYKWEYQKIWGWYLCFWKKKSSAGWWIKSKSCLPMETVRCLMTTKISLWYFKDEIKALLKKTTKNLDHRLTLSVCKLFSVFIMEPSLAQAKNHPYFNILFKLVFLQWCVC